MVHKGGRAVTISDLKEVLKAKTEEKDRHKGGEILSWGELQYDSWECQTTVSRQHTHKKKKASKNSETMRLNFFSYLT